ncbi:hypothetical protein [Novipirellula artificiosorum]|uniref:Uncharacterized protein n=1 Tax=Novipirellula artificiosorum TaxID=2528016 RepID=A0A5C6DAC8_9BACT|nr:hypothetical protein [Novipirellula artificiosorum]TWU33842.1 hypothetical protein Poly41_48410 [Novipirellula artificiosorum]
MEEHEHCTDESPADQTTATVEDTDAHDSDGRDFGEPQELKRRGDVEKCPVCGSQVDAEAYHCASCRNYFCFHCRSRLVPPDTQLQCVNQQCDYYGKLVCDVCDVSHEREEAPTVYAEPEDGYWPGWLLFAIIAFGCVWYFSSLQAAAWTAAGVFVLGGGLLHMLGVNVFGRNRIVEQQRKSAYHSCIRCDEVVKQVSKAK